MLVVRCTKVNAFWYLPILLVVSVVLTKWSVLNFRNFVCLITMSCVLGRSVCYLLTFLKFKREHYWICVNFTRWRSIAWNRVLIRLKVRQYILWGINIIKIRNHCVVTTPASKWSKLPLPVDGVRVRARVEFGLLSDYVFLSWLFPKIAILTQMPYKIDRKGTTVSVTTLVSTGDVEVCLQRFQWTAGLPHWRPFRFTLWLFDNLHFNYCSLKCLKNALFDMSFIKVNQNPNLYDFTGNG